MRVTGQAMGHTRRKQVRRNYLVRCAKRIETFRLHVNPDETPESVWLAAYRRARRSGDVGPMPDLR